METIKISIPYRDRNLKFDEILEKNKFGGLIPSNYFINKVRPIFGATHCELNALRNSIIIVGYISVMEVKQNDAEKYPICIVNGNIKDEEIIDYILDVQNSFNKIMVTPESFGRLINILKRIDKDYREKYFLLYDECEKLVQHGIFRPKLQLPLDEFFKFQRKTLITATPLIPSDPRFETERFRLLEFIPIFNYRKDLKLITTTNLRTSFRNQLKLYRDNRPVFIFTNCKKSILYGTQLEKIKSDYKVFCAEDLDKDFFQEEGVENVEYSVKHQQYAKYNFFTSRFFSAVDMYLPRNVKPHIIILTDLPNGRHSIINPFTDAVQIQGRVRTGFQTITHITKLFQYRDELSDGEINGEVDFNIKLIKKVQQMGLDYKNVNVQNTVDALIDNNFCSSLINDDFSTNTYSLDAEVQIES